jgi:hypothetical protein
MGADNYGTADRESNLILCADYVAFSCLIGSTDLHLH